MPITCAGSGFEKGDHVLLFLFNGPEFLKNWFALAKLGAVTVPLNTALRRLDLAYIVKDSDAKAIILDDALAENYLEVRKEVHLPMEILLSRGTARMEGVIPFGSLEKGPTENLETEIRPSDPACILYTSGTTGKPKGAILPHFAYISSGRAIARAIGVKEGDRLFTTLPLFHVGAQLVVALPAIIGDVDFAVARRFSASKFWDQIRRYRLQRGPLPRVHHPDSVPAARQARAIGTTCPIRMVGGGVPKDLWEKFEKRFGVTFLEGYGLTEGACITTWSPIGRVKIGSIGLPVAHQRVEVVNEEDEIVPPGVRGEIVIRPELPFSMTSGYYKKPEATLAAFRNLWFHTGDIAYKDEEGYLYFVGRKSQFIRRRGENISAEEIEEVISQHPKVEETGVVGVPSEVGEEDIKACYRLPAGRDHSRRDPPLVRGEDRLFQGPPVRRDSWRNFRRPKPTESRGTS